MGDFSFYMRPLPPLAETLIRWTKKAHSTDQQLVEFTFLIAWEPCVARFNRALGIEADDVSGNGCCLAPVAR